MPAEILAVNGNKVWSAEGLSQEDLMLKDECIVVNYLDEVVGHDNKFNCHKFIPGQPRGILHRAFSVLLFDQEGRLLVQQRALSKITFPGFWANTCCSHPLHGMMPSEVDSAEDISSGLAMGTKHAAVRKLEHELGIPRAQLHAERFKLMTRVHYWAADIHSHGKESPWGEHELDHILVYQLQAGEELTIRPNPEEVKAFKWLSRTELEEDMKEGILKAGDYSVWCPWFRIIMSKFLCTWWKDLSNVFDTDMYVDLATIHRFDTPTQYHGGAGHAGPVLDAAVAAEADAEREGGRVAKRKRALEAEHADLVVGLVGRAKKMAKVGDEGLKQGAYGKVPTHKFSKMDQLMRPLEVFAALRFKFANSLENNTRSDDPDVAFCDDMLGKVSRSFAAVIRQLPPGLCLDITIFYLVLRALDTVEDDMEAYKGREDEKQDELRSFGALRLMDTSCSMDGIGAGDERALLQQFGAVARVFRTLPEGSRDVIRNITDDMGAGMAEYVSADLAQGTANEAAYDRYCHMVAGLVGEGLTRIFVARGAEDESLCGQGERVWPFCGDAAMPGGNLGLANSMGLFLQKTNIIRDYLEDYVDGRAFWPQSVWRRYATTDDLGEFARPTAHGAGTRLRIPGTLGNIAAKGVGVQALLCLNDLVGDALELVPDSLEYLSRMRTPAIYRFCAIPQIMAMATLAECFDNPKLFTGVVKIRKGLTARLIQACCDGPDAVDWWFAHFAKQLLQSVESGACAGADGHVGARIAAACRRILALCHRGAGAEDSRTKRRLALLGAFTAAGAGAAYAFASARA
eukprot:TRINITY_DN15621_c0_g1_i1.p1 TRINITY_DN15621_c0_g1~~TRINITY_DN15621_c0_g1_i1.p1  ORF type:complete len:800 (-),score=176.78 TRINITY_DN15621_c0_g1_i1:24-2423(-)